MHAVASPSTQTERTSAPGNRFRWRVVDIVVAAVLGVATGLLFVVWNGIGYAWFEGLQALTPGFGGLAVGRLRELIYPGRDAHEAFGLRRRARDLHLALRLARPPDLRLPRPPRRRSSCRSSSDKLNPLKRCAGFISCCR